MIRAGFAGLALLAVCAFASRLPADAAGASVAAASDQDEGPPTEITGPVDFIEPDGEARMIVGVRPFAQAFFLYRTNRDYDEQLQLLRRALSQGAGVRLTVLRYSGRILTVAELGEHPSRAAGRVE